MDVRATIKYVHTSPRKLRLMADVIRQKSVQEASNLLSCYPRKGAKILMKLMGSAIANARNTGEMDMSSLYVKTIYVNKGPTIVRYMPRAMGRGSKITRGIAHATIVLSDY